MVKRLLCIVLLLALGPAAVPGPENGDSFREQRLDLVRRYIEGAGIHDTRVLDAMRRVPRHEFIPERYRDQAYEDHALPIGHEQTISQPFIVARMTEALALKPTDRVLEIGTGSGYQAAVLAELARQVYSIEIVEPLGLEARERLKRLGYRNVQVRIGDGYRGWPERAPFDAIIVTAAPDHLPAPLAAQLAEGGRLVIPVGDRFQELYVYTKHDGRLSRQHLLPVLFVPMTGEAQNRGGKENKEGN